MKNFNIVFGLIFATTVAYADPPANRPPENRPPNFGGSNVEQTTNVVSGSYSGAQAGARSDSNANAISGSSSNSVANGGRSSSSSNATGGTATATGGVGGEGGQGGEGGIGLGGDATGGNVGDTSSSSGGNVQNLDYKSPAASAAFTYAGYCQSGGAGQSEEGGFSVVNSDQFCDHIRAAEEMLRAYEREISTCVVECVGVCSDAVASVDQSCADNTRAQYYLDAYHENLQDAHNMVQQTQATGLIGRIAGQLAIPTALLAVLFIL